MTTGYWYNNFEFAEERARGLDHREDLFNPLTFKVSLNSESRFVLIASTEPQSAEFAAGYRLEELGRHKRSTVMQPSRHLELIQKLEAAAEHFIVARPPFKTVIAGYHWFGDWGRDTMIALPGLLLSTHQPETAKEILLQFLKYIHGGMLPNRFPDQGETPEYNTVDATLWFVEAIWQYLSYRDETEWRREALVYADLFNAFGTIDILVANAGFQRDSTLVDMTLAQWQFVLNVNLTGQFLCAREAAREFIRRGVDPERSIAAGRIICMSSVHEVIPWAGHCNYAASKGGIMLMMKSMAQELAPHRIRVNSIGPGAIKTPINRMAWETPEAEAELLKLIPYERVGEPDDIARAAVWLASDESDYVTGITLFVDGGMTLYPGFATGG